MKQALCFSRTRLGSHVSMAFSDWKALYHNWIKLSFFKAEAMHKIAKEVQTGTTLSILEK